MEKIKLLILEQDCYEYMLVGATPTDMDKFDKWLDLTPYSGVVGYSHYRVPKGNRRVDVYIIHPDTKSAREEVMEYFEKEGFEIISEEYNPNNEDIAESDLSNNVAYEPLKNFIQERLCDYSFSCRWTRGNIKIYAYKHLYSDRFLYIDEQGNFYRNLDGEIIDRKKALEYVTTLN